MSIDTGRRWRAAAIAAIAAAAMTPLCGAHAEPTLAGLLQRIEEQEQKIRVLERRLENQETAGKLSATAAAETKFSPSGFSLQSADGSSQLKLRGSLHVDGRFLRSDDPAGPTDTWQAGRVRPLFEGTLGGIYDFYVQPDFGQGRAVIQDAYVTARLVPGLQVTAGKFKSPVGLERLQSANDIRFVARGLPTSLAPNRDLGIKVSGNLFDRRLSYDLAWLNGSNDGSSSETFSDSDPNSGKEWVARLFAHPFVGSGHLPLRGLGLGIAATYTDQDGTATQTLLPSYRTPAQSTFFRYRTGVTPTVASGVRTRLAPQFYYYNGSLGLLGEYTAVSQGVAMNTPSGTREATLDTTAWQLAVSYFLTGEAASYRGFKPNAVFSQQDGTWGALEIVARVQELDVDDAAFIGGVDSFADPSASASKATAWGIGFNWYLNENLKWVLNYERTRFDGGIADGGDREDEEAFLVRMALRF